DGASGFLRQALELARQSDDQQLLAGSLDYLSRCHRLTTSGAADAEALARQALAEAERGQFASVAARARVTVASSLVGQGRPVEALVALAEAREPLERTGQRGEEARAALIEAVTARALGDAGWPAHLKRAAGSVKALRNLIPLHVEAAALGDELQTMADSPESQEAALDLLALAQTKRGSVTVVATADRTSRLPRIEAKLLGRPELLVDGDPPRDPDRSWSRRATRLLFFLLEQARGGVPADAIVDRLWPDAEPG